jgi:hypothetical protein
VDASGTHAHERAVRGRDGARAGRGRGKGEVRAIRAGYLGAPAPQKPDSPENEGLGCLSQGVPQCPDPPQRMTGRDLPAFNDPDGVFDANSVLLTTLVNNSFPSGEVGLYDFYSGLSFSNFSVSGTLVPGPVTVPGPVAGARLPGLFFAGVGLLWSWRRRRSSGV